MKKINFKEIFKNKFVAIALIVFSTIFTFLFGMNLESTACQKCAESFANIAAKESGSPIVAIYDKTETTARMFSDHYYGFEQFHSGHNVFAGYNAEKTKKSSLLYDNAHLEAECFNNLTLVTTRGLAVEKNKEGKNRNSYYDFDLMFSGIGKIDGYSKACFITETQARILMEKKDLSTFDELLGLKLTFECDDRDAIDLTVFNIILESGDEYNRYTENFGSFFVANDWEFLRKPFLEMYYFMNEVGFENFHNLRMIKDAYKESDVLAKAIHIGSNQNVIDKNNALLSDYFSKNSKTNLLSSIFSVAAVVLLSTSIILIIKRKLIYTILDGIIFSASQLIPYLVFNLIYVIIKNAAIFSYYSTVCLLVLTLILNLFIFGNLLYVKKRKDREINF